MIHVMMFSWLAVMWQRVMWYPTKRLTFNTLGYFAIPNHQIMQS